MLKRQKLQKWEKGSVTPQENVVMKGDFLVSGFREDETLECDVRNESSRGTDYVWCKEESV